MKKESRSKFALPDYFFIFIFLRCPFRKGRKKEDLRDRIDRFKAAYGSTDSSLPLSLITVPLFTRSKNQHPAVP